MENKKQGYEPTPPSSPPAGPPPPGGSMIKRPDASLAPMGERGIILRTFDELRQFAELAVKSGAAPSGMTPGGAALAIQAGLERGLGPLGGLQFCTIIEGTLSWNAKGASALIRNSPVCKKGSFRVWVEGKGKKRRGVAVAHRVGYAEPFRTEFSMEDAERAELLGRKNWRKYPDRQLRARAIGFLATDGFSDVLGGFPIEGEAADYDGPINVSPEPAPPMIEASAGPARTPGPDPVLEDLEKSAPLVIEVESTEPELGPMHSDGAPEQGPDPSSGPHSDPPGPETLTATAPPSGAPDLEVELTAEDLEKGEPSSAGREEYGAGPLETAARACNSLRSKLGVPPLAADGTEAGREAPSEAAGAEGRAETIGTASETPETEDRDPGELEAEVEASEELKADEKRIAHLQADAELAAADQGGLFDGKGKSES